MDTNIAVFKGKEIRRTLHKNEWWFSVVDVVEALTGSDRPRKYWADLKKKLADEGHDELSDKIGQLKLKSSDGKFYETDCTVALFGLKVFSYVPRLYHSARTGYFEECSRFFTVKQGERFLGQVFEERGRHAEFSFGKAYDARFVMKK